MNTDDLKFKGFTDKLSSSIEQNSHIETQLFEKFNVKRGLRNADHTGVLVGLTRIGDVVGYRKSNEGTLVAVDGHLFYRGINIYDLVKGFQAEGRHGFDETIYLLLTGDLPNKPELTEFSAYMAAKRTLPEKLKNSLLSLHGKNIMNILARSVLVLYNYDDDAEDTTTPQLIKQSLSLIAKFPTVIAYAYHNYVHQFKGATLSIRHPKRELTTAENLLYLLKGSGNYTALDADVLDLALVLHAEHGGGNNSTFTIRVTSSSGTDTYSSVASAIASLKGPLHGGANLEVMKMMDHLKKEIHDWKDEEEIKSYLMRILRKEAYNGTGKIYGIGHAVYTVSDPRAVLLKEKARELAIEKGLTEEFDFYERIELLGIQTFMEYKGAKVNKTVCANVDFYSGFVYSMIGLPKEIYTPLFAMSRMAGWTAHRIEELNFEQRRIIRPAYKNVMDPRTYQPLLERK
ncbi:citrate synthase [Prolixibacter sp. NT017]|uniref:citrate synthase n=1 Tax=Prolixibacter sp. NT017 TaxID=2652390 RepID=UPI0012790F9A|nr:citrate synthase [Prolixibacter sp. NT017]GET26953.1 citrate synthase [Prolixibacter sp. NT017]